MGFGVWGLGFGVWGLGFRVPSWGVFFIRESYYFRVTLCSKTPHLGSSTTPPRVGRLAQSGIYPK